jgi:hypothetical protein
VMVVLPEPLLGMLLEGWYSFLSLSLITFGGTDPIEKRLDDSILVDADRIAFLASIFA